MNIIVLPEHLAVLTGTQQRPWQCKHQTICRNDPSSTEWSAHGKFTRTDAQNGFQKTFLCRSPCLLQTQGWFPGVVSAPVGPRSAVAPWHLCSLGPTVLLPPGRASSSHHATECLQHQQQRRGCPRDFAACIPKVRGTSGGTEGGDF